MPSDTPTRPVFGGRGRVVTNESDTEYVLRMLDVVRGDAVEGERGVCGNAVAKGIIGGDMAEKKRLDILEALRFERARCLEVFFCLFFGVWYPTFQVCKVWEYTYDTTQ